MTSSPLDAAADAIHLSPPDPSATDEMTAEQLAEAKQYGRAQFQLGLADQVVDVVYLGLMAFLAAPALDHWLLAFIANDTLRLVALYAIVTGLHECLSLPLSYYSGHVIEHRYGLSRQSLTVWLSRHLKQFALGAGFGLVLFVGLFWIIRLAGPWWWLAAALAFFLLSVVLSQLVPVLILPLFYKIERLDQPALNERMARLAAGTGLSIEGVYRMRMSAETAKANAMLAGLGRTRRVIMGDTLLDQFSPDEIEVIFAHEIGHHVHRHIYKMILIGLVFSIAGFWVCDLALRAWVGQTGAAFDYRQLPAYALIMLMFVLTTFFMALGPLQNFISRRFERQCDRYALDRTGLKQAYLSAFRKLARLNKDDPDPNPIEVFLFHSHPPIAERLALAEP